MGGRGASLGIYVKNKKVRVYGSEYHSLHQIGNIKYVEPNEGSTTAPMETMTPGRIYATIDKVGDVRYISFYDQENKRVAQVDVKGRPHLVNGEYILPHTHLGYVHDENNTRNLNKAEKTIVEKVLKEWDNFKKKNSDA